MAFEFRTFDPRVGRFLSTDPLTATTPWETPYAFAGNSPVANIDYLGLSRVPAQGSSAPPEARKKKGGSFWSGVGRAMGRGFMEGIGRPAPVQTYEMTSTVQYARDNSFDFGQQLNIKSASNNINAVEKSNNQVTYSPFTKDDLKQYAYDIDYCLMRA